MSSLRSPSAHHSPSGHGSAPLELLPASTLLDIEDALDGRIAQIEPLPQRSHAEVWSTYRITLDDATTWHLRVGTAAPAGLFTRFADGYREMSRRGIVPTPRVEAVDEQAGRPSLLVTSLISPSRPAGLAPEQLGWSLGALHSSGARSWGTLDDNPLGFVRHLPMDNSTAADPIDWLVERRIAPLADAALSRGVITTARRREIDRLTRRLERWFAFDEAPVTVHGNLWRDTISHDQHGRPWLKNPTAHGSIPETDLTTLTTAHHPKIDRVLAAYREYVPEPPHPTERLAVSRLITTLALALENDTQIDAPITALLRPLI